MKDIAYVSGNFLIARLAADPWDAGILYFLGLNALVGMWLVPMIPLAITFWCMLSQDEIIETESAVQTDDKINGKSKNFRKKAYALCSMVLTPVVTVIRYS